MEREKEKLAKKILELIKAGSYNTMRPSFSVLDDVLLVLEYLHERIKK